MKRIASFFLALALAFSLTACTVPVEKADDGKIQIVATLFPYYDFARAIVGDRADVTLLLSPGREAHSFEPTPLDAVTISESDVFLYNGGEGEYWVDSMLDAAGENIAVIARMMDYVDALDEEYVEGMQGADGHDHDHEHGSHDDHDDHDHDYEEDEHDSDEVEYDEHIWTSPKNAVVLCRAVCDAICKADPANEDFYRANCDGYCAQIEALEGILRSVRAEELTPFAARDGEVRYTLSFNDDYTGYYGFSLSENGQVTLEAPAEYETEGEPFPYTKAVAVVNNAELTQALYRLLRPALLDGLTAAQRDAVDSFLHWAQALRAEDILNLRFQSGSSSRFLVDAELTALSAQLVPALNALTEADLYTQQGYGDSAYYTLSVITQDGERYTFFCGFDRVRLLHPTFEPGLSSSYPSDRPTLWIDSPALMACIDSLEASPAPLPDFETAAPTPLADILPAREPWLTIPLAGKAQRIADRRIPSDALDWLTQMDMDGDGVCEIVNSSDFPAIYYKRGGELYGVDLKSVITAAWPELNWWDYTSAAPASRSLLFCGLSAGDAPGDGVNFTRYLYFDGESLLLYKPDRSHTDHVADATLADPSVPAEVAARAKQLVRQRYDTLAGSAAQYDDWYTDVSFLGTETRYAGLAPEVYCFSQHYHAQKPEKILLAGGTEVDEDGWAILDGDMVLDGPYIVCLMDGGTRRILEGSMSGDCSTGSPAYYSDLTALLAKNNVLRPDALDGGRLKEAMSSGISFLNWLGQYDAAEQDRALERLSAYRASLTDSYDLDMFSRIVTYLLGDRDGLTDAGRAAQERFRAKFR